LESVAHLVQDHGVGLDTIFVFGFVGVLVVNLVSHVFSKLVSTLLVPFLRLGSQMPF
jgi:hypothetical protein